MTFTRYKSSQYTRLVDTFLVTEMFTDNKAPHSTSVGDPTNVLLEEELKISINTLLPTEVIAAMAAGWATSTLNLTD